MASTSTPAPIVIRLTKYLPLAERAFLAAILVGALLSYLQIDTNVLKVALVGLAVVFFMYTYKPLNLVRGENESPGLSDLLAVLILPKVLWIGSAVSTLGIAFYLFDLGNEAYKDIIMVGGSSICIALVLLTLFLVSGVKHLKMVTPILMRAVPLLMIDFYILLN